MSSTFNIHAKVRKDHFYFHKYYIWIIFWAMSLNVLLINLLSINLTVLLLFLPGMFLLRSTHFILNCIAMIYCLFLAYSLEGSLITLATYSTLAIFWQLSTNSLLHLSSHDSFLKNWISRTIGEILSFFYLVGFPEWQQIHMEHHRYPDHPEKDPHPPKGLTFVSFLLGMRKSVGKVFVLFYKNLWPDVPFIDRKLNWLIVLAITSQFLKMIFWFLLLGPIGFGIFYAITLVVKNISYAHFNYYTHIQQDDEIKIINLKNGLFWKFLNTITFGLYYHKNHHLRPRLFNPSTLTNKSQLNKNEIYRPVIQNAN